MTLFGIKLSTNVTVVVIFLSAVGSIVYLSASKSPVADALIPVIFTGALSAIGLVLKQGETDAKVATIAPKVDQAAGDARAAVVAVADNTALTQKIADTGEQTYVKVDGQMSAFRKTLAELSVQQIAMISTQARLDATQAQLDQALASARALETGRQQVITENAAAATAPPIDGALDARPVE